MQSLEQLEQMAQGRMSLELTLKSMSNHAQSRKEGAIRAAVCALGGMMSRDSLG